TKAMVLRPGLGHIWQTLRDTRLKIGLCSNLAAPYGPPLRALLPDAPDAEVLSYNEGHIKPEPEIYHRVIKQLGVPANRILFVGDTYRADIEGPQEAGMQAMEIAQFETIFEEMRRLPRYSL
ncbi:MAG: HAD family hydrolase, partial [Pseudomonadota bacterium]